MMWGGCARVVARLAIAAVAVLLILPGAASATVWYVNDTSTAGDSFTVAVGNDSQSGAAPDSPFRTLNALEGVLSIGDTVYIDSGWYYEADTVTISCSNLWIIGADSLSSTIRFSDTSAASNRHLRIQNCADVRLYDLGISGGHNGLVLSFVDQSRLERIRVDGSGNRNIDVADGDTNTVVNCHSLNAGYDGLLVEGNSGNTIETNLVETSATYGIHLYMTNGNAIYGNEIRNCGNHGFFSQEISSGNLISNNTSHHNAQAGFTVGTGSAPDDNMIVGNVSHSNTWAGIDVDGMAGGVVAGNYVHDNGFAGLVARTAAAGVLFYGNTADSNADWGINIWNTLTAGSCTFVKNNLYGPPTSPDSCVWIDAAAALDLSRNWFGSADSAAIYAKMGGAGRPLATYAPYRFGAVDTAVGADTVAPRAPDTVAAVALSDSSIRISWSPVTLDEENDSFATNLTWYNIYRSATPNTSVWEAKYQVGPGTLSAVDLGLTPSATWYYRVTALDNWPTYPNESFYSDSTCSATTNAVGGNTIAVAANATTGKSLDQEAPTFETGVLSFRVTSSGPDTVEIVSVSITDRNGAALDTMDVDTVSLSIDADRNGEWAAGIDTSLGPMVFDTATSWWRKPGLSVAVLGGSDSAWFVVSFDLDTSFAEGDTFRVGLPIAGCSSANGGTAPATPVFNAAVHEAMPQVGFWRASFAWPRQDTFLSPDTAYLQVGDGSANAAPGLVETLVVVVTKLSGAPDTETRICTEATANVQIFRESLPISSNPADSVPENGMIFAAPGDVLQIAYQGLSDTVLIVSGAGANTAAVVLVATSPKTINQQVFVETGVVAFRVASSGPDTIVEVGVRAVGRFGPAPDSTGAASVSLYQDANKDGEWQGSDTFLVGMTYDPALQRWRGVGINVPTLGGADSIWFVGTMVPDGNLIPGDTFQLQVPAFACTTSVAGTAPAAPVMTAVPHRILSMVGFFDQIFTTLPDTYATPDTAYLEVTDAMANLNPVSPETVAVVVTKVIGPPDTETVTLTEIFADSGIFTSQLAISTDPADSAVQNGKIYGVAGETLQVRYFIDDIIDTVMLVGGADAVPPAVFTLTSPADLLETTSFTIVFDWDTTVDTGSGLNRYMLQLSTDAAFANSYAMINEALADSTLQSITTNDTTYWRVIAYDNAGNSRASAVWSLMNDQQAPNTATLVSPVGGAAVGGPSVILDWNATTDSLSGLLRYHVQVSTTAVTYANPVVDGYQATPDTTATLGTPAAYYWRVYAEDDVGNSSPAAADSFVVTETTPPSVFTLTAPANLLETTAAVVLFDWDTTVDTGSGLQQYVLQLSTSAAFANSYAWVVVGASTDSSVQPITTNDTTYWRVIAYDNVGNTRVSTATWSLMNDQQAPNTATLVSPVGGAAVGGPSVILDWNATTDSLSGLLRYHVQVSTTAVTYANPVVDGYQATPDTTVTLGTPAAYYWRVYAEDDVGNSSPAAADSFVVTETTPPSVFTLAAPANLLETTAAVVLFDWDTTVDTGSGLQQYVLQLSTSAAFANSYAWVVVGASTDSSVQPITGNDTTYWRVIAYDNVGNTRVSTATWSLMNDQQAPNTATLVSPVGGAAVGGPSVILDWNATTDSLSGLLRYHVQVSTTAVTYANPVVDGYQASPDTTVSLGAPGSYYWRVYAQDDVGNSSPAAADSFVVTETTPPSVFTLAAPANLLETTGTVVLFDWDTTVDTGSGLQQYVLQLSTSAAFANSYAWVVVGASTDSSVQSITTNDTTYWRVIAYDNVGNTRASTATWSLMNDQAPPTPATLVSPISGASVGGPVVVLDWNASTDSLSGLLRYHVQVSTVPGTLSNPVVNGYQAGPDTTVTLPATQDTWYWRVYAQDDVGNSATSAIETFRVPETEPPTVFTLASPADLTNTTTSFLTFAWNASADTGSGLNQYVLQFSTSGGFAPLYLNQGVGLVTSSPQSLTPNDTTFWRVIAVDNAGNTRAATASFSIFVAPPPEADPPSPSPAPLSPVAGHETTAATINFTWSASSDSSPPVTYRLQAATSGAFTPLFVDSTTVATNLTATLPSNQSYTWRVIAIDAAGNSTSFPATSTLTVDQTPPTTPGLTDPTAGESQTSPVTFTWTVSTDALSGFFQYRIQVSTIANFAYPVEDQAQAFLGAMYNLAPDTYFWRVYAQDDAGNSSVSTTESVAVAAGSDSTPPAPVGGLSATSNADGTIQLDWVASASPDMDGGGQYNVYWDNGGGIPTLLLTVVGHVDGQVPYTYTTGALVNGLTYAFVVRAVDRNANENADTNKVLAAAQVVGGTPVHAVIDQPMAGTDVLGTQSVYVGASIDPSSEISRVLTVAFQYRADTTNPSAPWTAMVAFDAASPNPATPIGGYANLFWSTAALNTGPYQVRAVANLNDATSDSAAPIIVVNIVSNPALADQSVVIGGGAVDATFIAQPDMTYTYENPATGDTFAFTMTDGSETVQPTVELNADGSVEVTFTAEDGIYMMPTDDGTFTFTVEGADTAMPAEFEFLESGVIEAEVGVVDSATYAMGNETTTGGVTLPDGTLTNATDTLNMNFDRCADTVPEGRYPLSINVDLSLASGQSTFGVPVTVVLSYPDADSDGFVDGTPYREEEVEIHVFTGGQWEQATVTLRDLANNRVYGQIGHFSNFVLVGGGNVAATMDTFVVAPNPWRPNDGIDGNGKPFASGVAGTGIWFLNLPSQVRIQVFSITGRRVAEFSTSNSGGSIQWDVKNDAGADVASGYYVYTVQNLATGERKTGKLAIIR